jgi:hypothetical protein
LSRIFDAIKRAESAQNNQDAEPTPVPPVGERRRSPRRKASVPIYVYGHNPAQQPFHEEAYSAVISELGGLLVMRSTVHPGQSLLLTNKVTQKEQECRVAYVGGLDPQSVQVAVEFPIFAPDFWRLTAQPRSATPQLSSGNKSQAG